MTDPLQHARDAGRTADAPAPDDPIKPGSPTDLGAATWRFTLRSTLRSFGQDGCSDLAAGLTYYAVMAIFPALLAVVSILGIIGQGGRAVEAMVSLVRQIAPGEAATIVGDIITVMASEGGAGVALVIGTGLALWSASGYVGGFGRMLNRIYEVAEGRPAVRLRLANLALTVAIVLAAVLTVVLLVVGGPAAEAVGGALGIGGQVVVVFSVLKWPVMLVVVVAVVAALYHFTPNVRQPRFRWLSIGAAVAIAGCLVASAGFALYVANVANYNKTYGTLGGVIVLLLWLYLTNLALLFGAELDAELERGRQLAAGLPAQGQLLLPPKDTSAVARAQAREQDWLEAASRLQEAGVHRQMSQGSGAWFQGRDLDSDGFAG